MWKTNGTCFAGANNLCTYCQPACKLYLHMQGHPTVAHQLCKPCAPAANLPANFAHVCCKALTWTLPLILILTTLACKDGLRGCKALISIHSIYGQHVQWDIVSTKCQVRLRVTFVLWEDWFLQKGNLSWQNTNLHYFWNQTFSFLLLLIWSLRASPETLSTNSTQTLFLLCTAK